mmetsp:Transcript_45132/g.120797  ORF Transcript_45132/g.120797 Transcript_45132/m.120797 type:complete len:221 (-) Transcript_45132:163-825(-)
MLDHVMNSNLDGEPPDDLELQDFCVAMAFAGHDTTLATMQTMLHHLDANPSVKYALRQEVDSVWDGSSPVTRALLQKLHKCRAFSLESIRLTPPVQTMSRILAADALVDGYALKAGMTIMLSAASITDSSFGADSAECRVDRYLDGQGSFADKTHDFEQCSGFGCGGRMCIGYKFALDEMAVFLLNLLHGYDFAVASRTQCHFPFNFYRVTASFNARVHS